MRCPHCQEEHPDGSVFCANTGISITPDDLLLAPAIEGDPCPMCGGTVPNDESVCPSCGFSISAKLKEEDDYEEAPIPFFSRRAIKIIRKITVVIIVLAIIIGGGYRLWQDVLSENPQVNSFLEKLKPGTDQFILNTPDGGIEAAIFGEEESTSTPLPTTPTVTPTVVPTITLPPTITPIPIMKRPCASYYDQTNGDLKYACQIFEDRWEVETVDSDGDTGLYTSLVFSPSGKAHISYYRADTGTLKYAVKSDGEWEDETAANLSQSAVFTSIILEPDGQPIIMYYDQSDAFLKIAFKRDGEWMIEEVTQVGSPNEEQSESFYASMVIDEEGKVMAAYYDTVSRTLKLATRRSNDWKISDITETENTGQYCSLTLDSKGYPAVSYLDEKEGWLYLARRTRNYWQFRVVDKRNTGKFSSVAFDQLDVPHVSYYDEEKNNLKFAELHESDDSWLTTAVDYYGVAGLYTSIVIDQENNPIISYYDFQGGNFKVAYFNGGWKIDLVDREGNVGLYTSLAFEMGYGDY